MIFRAPRPHRLLVLLVLLGGAALRLIALDAKPLWLDEAFSLWMASHPLPNLLDWLIEIDQHPPLYYLLLRGWISLWGDSPGALRLLSAFSSIATLPLFYTLVCQVTADRRLALLALALLAVSPFHIHYAQEARMYALLTLLVMVTMAGYVALWQGRGQPLLRHLAPLTQAAAMLTHNIAAVFLPLVLNSIALLWWWQRPHSFSMRRWLRGQVLALLIWLPWSVAFVDQAVGVDQRFWLQPPTVHDVWAAFHTLTFEFLPGGDLWLGLILGVAGWGIWRLRRQRLATLLPLWLGLPLLGLLLLSLRRPLFHPPSLLWLSPPYLLWMAAGLLGLGKWRWLRGTLCAGVLFLNGVALHGYYVNFHKEAWDEVAYYVADHASPGDLVLFNATWVQIPFDYYFPQTGTPLEKHGVPVDLFARGELEPAMTMADLPRLRQLIARHDQVWLVYSHDWFTDPQQIIPTTLAQTMSLQQERTFTGIRLFRYQRRPP